MMLTKWEITKLGVNSWLKNSASSYIKKLQMEWQIVEMQQHKKNQCMKADIQQKTPNPRS